ncbi:MAG: DUF4149 domain-containing protein [Campylobacteraceae bacterium]|jgi:hypothetical protein|nr:DUF4149 domain-containing protein [Campylobacteraceae bacterium]
MKSSWQKSFFIVYLLLLGLCIGAEVAVGVLTAPIIFYPDNFLGVGILDRFQSGILMTQIFLKFNVLLMLCMFFAAIYEIYLYKIKKYDFISVVILFIALFGSMAFVLYFTPYIVEAQIAGAEATATEAFKNIHGWSEIVMKVILLSQITLFFRRVWLFLK